MTKLTTPVCFRLSETTREALRRAANAELRSVSAQAEVCLQRSLRAYLDDDKPQAKR